MVKVSIIIPIYNVAPYLRRCLDSVINQTLQDIEIILASDGPQDCHDICDEYARKDKRIKVVKDKGSYGKSANVALDISKGKYIGIVESDDACALDMFKKLYTAAEKHNADVVKAKYYTITNGEKAPSYMPHFSERANVTIYTHPRFLFTSPSIWSAIYKKDFLKRNNIRFIEDKISFIDMPFFAETFIKSKRYFLLQDCLYYYYSDNPNQSVKSTDKIMDPIITARYIYERVKKTNNFNKFRDYFYVFSIKHLIWQLNRISDANKGSFFEEAKKYVLSWENKIKKLYLLNYNEKLLYKTLVNNLPFSAFKEQEQKSIKKIKIFNKITIFRIITYTNRKDYILFKYLKLYAKRENYEA